MRMIAHIIGLTGKPVSDVTTRCQIPTLESKWINTDIAFIFKLLNNKNDCLDILEQIFL